MRRTESVETRPWKMDAGSLADGYSRQLTDEIKRVTELLLAEHGRQNAKATHEGVCRIFGRLFFNEARVAEMAEGRRIEFGVRVPAAELDNGKCACLLCEAITASAQIVESWETSDPVQVAAREMLTTLLIDK